MLKDLFGKRFAKDVISGKIGRISISRTVRENGVRQGKRRAARSEQPDDAGRKG